MAFDLFLKGNSQRVIAQQLGIAPATLARWSVREGWVAQRELEYSRLREEFVKNNLSHTSQAKENMSLALCHALTEIIAERRLYCQGKIKKKQMKFSNKDLIAAAKASAYFHEPIMLYFFEKHRDWQASASSVVNKMVKT